MIDRNIQSGFTLIELLIVMCILGIITSFAVPSFNSQISNNRSVTQTEHIVAAIALARAEAIKRAGRVSICASSDGATCTGSWIDGYIIFYDYATRDDASTPTLTDSSSVSRIVRYSGKQHDDAQITVTRNSTSVSFFRFTSMGTLAQIDSYPVIINSKIQSCTSDSARKITIATSGIVKVESIDC